MKEFFQDAPELHNQFTTDRVLDAFLRKNLGSVYAEVKADLHRFGDRVATDVLAMNEEVENNHPQHVPYSPWGKRIDEIKVTPAWNGLDRVSAEEGIVAAGYERKFGDKSRIYQFAKIYLFHPSSGMYTCPLAMTDGAARLIELYGSPEMKDRALTHLTSRDPKMFWTSGQWMTERTGGSDVSGTSTVAKFENGTFRLYGVKWFTSATTSQMAMTLAKIEGEEKLSLFYLELRNESGELQNIQINRLKDKLGTKGLPTAELTLTGTPAVLVGEKGKGVKTIATLFNVTRLYNACCAVGYMRRGLALAKDYAGKRKAFGKTLVEHGLHVETLADLQVRFEASFQLAFHAIKLLGKEELKTATHNEAATLRLLIPLAKLFTAKEGVHVCSEIIESFGGAGYIEDTGLPVLLRNAQVLSIWEGTTNVLSLDSLRAIQKENAGPAFLSDIQGRLNSLKRSELSPLITEVSRALKEIQTFFTEITSDDDLASSSRSLAMTLSRTFAASLLLEQAEWSLENDNDPRPLLSARRWIAKGLSELQRSSLTRRTENLELIS